MSEQTQRISLDGATRVTFDISGAHLTVNWRVDIDAIHVSGGELSVDRAGDEIFLRLERRTRGGGLFDMLPSISTPGVKINWGGSGSSIEVSDEEGVVVQTGRGRGEDAPRSSSIEVDLPVTITATSIELESGDLALTAPHGRVDSQVKTGRLRSTGGDASLTAALGSGDARVRDLAGTLNVMGGSGNVEIANCRAAIQVKAGSGKITLDHVSGDAIDLMAGSGDVTVSACTAGELSCQTGSGDLVIDGGELDQMTVRSGSGEVSCSAKFGPDSQTFVAGSGSVSLGVPRGLPTRFEVSTQGGEIDSDIQLVSVGQRGPRSRRTRRQVGSIGTGEPRAEVSVRTSSGDIHLYWLRGTSAAPDISIPMPAQMPVQTRAASDSAEGQADADAAEADAETETGEPDQREVILQSLARGEISVDEADELLRSLETQR